MDKNKTVCFTGHRQIKKEKLSRLNEEIKKAIQKGYDTFLSGGALGFDQYAAWAIIELKEKYPDIKLIMVLPCKEDIISIKWKDEEKESLFNLCKNSDEIIYISENYYDGCIKERNKRLTDLSSYCIAYYNRYISGTGQTIRMSEKNGSTVINILQ